MMPGSGGGYHMNMPPAREPIPDLPVRESSVSKPESGVFSLLTVVTLSLHVALAFRVAAYYGTERAENFWWLLVLSLIVHLVGIVFLVSRVSAQQTAAGYNLKKKLDEDQQTSSGLLPRLLPRPLRRVPRGGGRAVGAAALPAAALRAGHQLWRRLGQHLAPRHRRGRLAGAERGAQGGAIPDRVDDAVEAGEAGDRAQGREGRARHGVRRARQLPRVLLRPGGRRRRRDALRQERRLSN